MSALPLSTRASAADPSSTGLIDVHAHCLPPAYLAAMSAAGVKDVDGFPLPPWEEAAHLALMDRHGITASLLSISAPGVMFVEGQAARDLARRINEEAAERRLRTRGRMGAFALLLLPDVEGSLREMEYALDTLKLDGIGLYTNARGAYLGDTEFDPIFAEARRRDIVVYTHPVAPPGFAGLSQGFPGPAIEYPFDTTRMLLNMAAKGTLRRHAGLKLIASHGGGATPYLAERISNLVALMNRGPERFAPADIYRELGEVYYDCTAVANPVSLAAYKAFVPPDRRLFGSDAPFMPEMSIPPALATLRSDEAGLPQTERAALEHDNAARLFPDLMALLAT